ncbi:MAG: response regulator [Myxococcales bacterium]|nr:response regulator [Myxococcales bacterium]
MDADDASARFTAELLADCGCAVGTAQTAEHARALLVEDRFDAVVTDLHLPGESGFALLAWIERHLAHVVVLATSAYGDAHTEATALQTGAEAFVSKPFDPARLVLAVERALRDKEPHRTR